MKYLLCMVLLSLSGNALANDLPEPTLEQVANQLLDQQDICHKDRNMCEVFHQTCKQITVEEDKAIRQWGQENSSTEEVWTSLEHVLDECKALSNVH